MDKIKFVYSIIDELTKVNWYSIPEYKYWYKWVSEDLYQLFFWAGTNETKLSNIKNIEASLEDITKICSEYKVKKIKILLEESKKFFENNT